MAGKMSATDKALQINLEGSRYGTFAEIGAGQEVARHFFVAGKASNTIAKTISAYDMTFSDEIYGRESSGRYVCQSRVERMLGHEYGLVDERLRADRGGKSRFFAYANTVTTNSTVLDRCHGWMGVRYQTLPGGPTNDIIMHVRMKDNLRLMQQEALGILGVNLLHSAFFVDKEPAAFVRSLYDNIHKERVEIDMLSTSGPDLEGLDDHLLALELVRQELTQAVLFDTRGDVVQAADVLYDKNVLVQRGAFRPITKTNISILEAGLTQFKRQINSDDVTVFLEITINDLTREGSIDARDFLDRVDTIARMGHNVLISNLSLFFQLKQYLRRLTRREIGLVVGASTLPKLYDAKVYEQTPGNLLEAFGRLFDDKTCMLVYPFKSDASCATAKVYSPGGADGHLHRFLLESGSMIDILGCDDVATALHSSAVRDLLAASDPRWETLVPQQVAELIKSKRLFGYRG